MIGLVELLILMALCLGPLLLIALVLAVVVLRLGDGKVCPYCAERIRANARVCRYCGRDLESEQDVGGGYDGEESAP